MIVEAGIESRPRKGLTMVQSKLESDLMGDFATERELFQDLRKIVGAEALKWLMSNVALRPEGQRRVVAEGGPAPLF